jgi:type IV pilus assembly protein PilX
MNIPANQSGRLRGRANSQRGVVLFFALIALVVMSLAAVALIRSVDTSTMIAGNLAFKQAATTSGDGGIESAVTALNTAQAAMIAINNNVLIDPGCPSACSNVLNATNAANGYYSSITDPALTSNLTDSSNWANTSSMLVTNDDGSGNEIRYIIQRMCRTANQAPSKTNCLFSSAALDNNGQEVPLPSNICQGSGCPVAGQAPEYRITSRSAGPGNTFSYVQAFVY